MDNVQRLSDEPIELKDYKIGGETTGVFPTWYPHHRVLQDMCEFLARTAKFYLAESTPETKKDRAYEVIKDFAGRYIEKMKGRHNNVFPW